jgi:dipeptidyl aminopeptidase/acylaminoacyl peptidase
MRRAGGEAQRYTESKGAVLDYVWSSDAKRIALIIRDPDPECTDPSAGSEKKTRKPIAIDRYRFKDDEEGYLTTRRKHLYVLDVATKKLELLLPGDHDEQLPTWSPDGTRIAYSAKRGADPDRTDNWDVFVIDAHPGAKARALTSYEGADSAPSEDYDMRPAFSPDGKHIAYLRSGAPSLIYYAVKSLAVVSSSGGEERVVMPSLDRTVSNIRWSKDGDALYFLIEEDGKNTIARAPLEGGSIERLPLGDRDATAFSLAPNGRIAVLATSPHEPPEVYAYDAGALRRLSTQDDARLAGLDLAHQEEIAFSSKDGTMIQGYVMRPPNPHPRPQPTILWIHGGPTLQFDRTFFAEWQMFASRGYVVVGANPRGSSGRGEAFSKAIYADWGNKDGEDVLAAVDHVVAKKIADPDRLFIGGWSYGAILTNAVILRDHRFKAAVSGAGQSNVLAGYGTDMYVHEYEVELGPPWKATDLWIRLSAPFFHADRISTPTLFLCGDRDLNVPLLNSEQMYEALKSLGIDTELVIYPGESHEIKKPSYRRDRIERYLSWFQTHAPGLAKRAR